MKKTLYTLCCMVAIAIMTATTLTSCDSNASDLKMERITGLYAGTVIVGLYTPDLMVEADNEKVGLNEDLALCSDTIKSTIKLDFLNDGHVKIGVDELKDIDFGIPFLDEHNNVREIFSDGYLAQAYNAVREMVAQGQLTDEEFAGFCEIIDTLTDKLVLSSIETDYIVAAERGAMLTTYDYEQNSYYAQFNLSPFKYDRTSNITEAMEYLRNLMQQKGIVNEQLQNFYAAINGAIPTSGSIANGWGWCTMAYSNYNTYIDMHIERATGLLDKLTLALFGNSEVQAGHFGYLQHKREVWFVVEYFGQIEDTGKYKEIIE